MKRCILFLLFCAGCAAAPQHAVYFSYPTAVANTGVCVAAKVEVAGTGPCEQLPITNYELMVVPCGH